MYSTSRQESTKPHAANPNLRRGTMSLLPGLANVFHDAAPLSTSLITNSKKTACFSVRLILLCAVLATFSDEHTPPSRLAASFSLSSVSNRLPRAPSGPFVALPQAPCGRSSRRRTRHWFPQTSPREISDRLGDKLDKRAPYWRAIRKLIGNS